METLPFTIRPAGESDFDGWFTLFETVAAEGTWIGRELPVDRDDSRRRFVEEVVKKEIPDIALMAESGGEHVGQLLLRLHDGIADLGMAVDPAWRGQGVGTALLATGLDRARDIGVHKVALQVWPHNRAAWLLYEKFGFVEEGRLRRQYRRRNGELWDAIIMGLVLDTTSPGSSLAAMER